MAEKHETVPTAVKLPKEFRKTVKIGSASSLDKYILLLFHVGFDQNDFSDIRNFISKKYFQAPDNDVEYARRTSRI